MNEWKPFLGQVRLRIEGRGSLSQFPPPTSPTPPAREESILESMPTWVWIAGAAVVAGTVIFIATGGFRRKGRWWLLFS